MTMTVGIVNLGDRSWDVLVVNGRELRRGQYMTIGAVSYTHLTLPTICSV